MPVGTVWLIDPALVQGARKICGARTETETVSDEIDKAFRRHGSVLADLENVFPDGVARRR